jgi:hypothetical protein
MVTQLTECRICQCRDLTEVLDLGVQKLTGVFPRDVDQPITEGPLSLLWCRNCSLLQLKHSYSLPEMYGANYGYRSGLNASMVEHLTKKIESLEAIARPEKQDIVIDIGSNDATSLRAYRGSHAKVGIDPTGEKFRRFYTSGIDLIADFFSADKFFQRFPSKKAKIITSIAMFYDLESPVDFVKDIHDVLADDGIWHFEQSYMPSMLRTTAYDTICHEHLEFYSFRVVMDVLARCGLRAIDIKMNGVNGGSFAVTACKESAKYRSNTPIIEWTLRNEKAMGLTTVDPYHAFATRVFSHRESLLDLIESLVGDGKRILAYGASTKGNVLLQFCGLDTKHLACVAEVNEDKFGAFTPGSNIPIVSEYDARALKPDYFLALPWHFKHGILQREREFLAAGGHFIFPLPEIEII